MVVYRLRISIGEDDDSVVFRYQPTREQALSAFESRSRQAGEAWEFLYRDIAAALKGEIPGVSFSPLVGWQVGTGGPLWREGKVIGTWELMKWEVVDNG